MVELVDAGDSKSPEGNLVPVRVRPPAPAFIRHGDAKGASQPALVNISNVAIPERYPVVPRLICPDCGSFKLQRSRTRGKKEIFLKFFGFRPYRCGEENCYWRGLLNPNLLHEKITDFFQEKRIFIWITLGIIGCILLIFLLAAWRIRFFKIL